MTSLTIPDIAWLAVLVALITGVFFRLTVSGRRSSRWARATGPRYSLQFQLPVGLSWPTR